MFKLEKWMRVGLCVALSLVVGACASPPRHVVVLIGVEGDAEDGGSDVERIESLFAAGAKHDVNLYDDSFYIEKLINRDATKEEILSRIVRRIQKERGNVFIYFSGPAVVTPDHYARLVLSGYASGEASVGERRRYDPQRRLAEAFHRDYLLSMAELARLLPDGAGRNALVVLNTSFGGAYGKISGTPEVPFIPQQRFGDVYRDDPVAQTIVQGELNNLGQGKHVIWWTAGIGREVPQHQVANSGFTAKLRSLLVAHQDWGEIVPELQKWMQENGFLHAELEMPRIGKFLFTREPNDRSHETKSRGSLSQSESAISSLGQTAGN